MSHKEERRPTGRPMGGPGGHMGGPAEKPKDFKGTMGKLLRYLGRHRVSMFVVLVFAALGTVFAIVGPKVLAKATNEIVRGVMALAQGTGTVDLDYVARIVLALAGLYGISALFSYVQSFVMAGISTDVSYRLRQDIEAKIHRLPLKYFESNSLGDILSRITNDVDTINQSLHQSIQQIITSVTMLIGTLVMMLSINLTMTAVTVLIVPFTMVLSLLVIKKSQKYFIGQQRYLGEVNGRIEESYSGHKVVRAFCAEEQQLAAFDGSNRKLYDSAWRAQFLSSLIMPASNFIGNLGYVVICVLGATRASAGAITIGDIQAFLQYVRSFNQPISQIANISNVLQQTAAAAERVFAFLAEPEETPESATPVRVTMRDGKQYLTWSDGDGAHEQPFVGEIVFDHVSFGYTPEKKVIHDFSAHVAPGDKVALVGHTGAGKTTVVKLLLRFYDVDEGRITIDGHDIRSFTRNDLRSLFGMVLQDTWLYGDTIAENIRYGRRTASDEEVVRAAKAARIDHYIRTLPGSYGEMLDEESANISQGQRQLMTIARAILADPDILILDEATSSVDTKTEVDIQRAMDRLMEKRTSFVIAHRLSTIRDCGLILVMEDGDIVEQGDHASLLEQGGVYADLYNSQFDKAS